jgi:hypothetical protein
VDTAPTSVKTRSIAMRLPSGWIFKELRDPFKDVRPRSEQYRMSRWRSRVSHEELVAQAVDEAMSDSEYELV